jgi:hypothetical protein
MAIETCMQGVIFPAGARALPAENSQISQEILIKPPLTVSNGRYSTVSKYIHGIMLFISLS